MEKRQHNTGFESGRLTVSSQPRAYLINQDCFLDSSSWPGGYDNEMVWNSYHKTRREDYFCTSN
jgi:hypothetical protein